MKKFWFKISNMGVTKGMDIESSRKIVLLNQIAILLFSLIISIRVILLVSGIEEFSPKIISAFFIISTILLIPYFNSKGFNRIAAFTFVMLAPTLSIVMSSVSQLQQEVVDINYYYYPRFILLSELVLPLILINSKHKILLYTALIYIVLCLVFFDVIVNFVGLGFNHSTISFVSYEVINYIVVIPVLLIVLAILFLIKLNKNYEEKVLGLNKYLTEQNDELEDLNEELTLQQDTIIKRNEELEIVRAEVELINNDLTSSIMYAERIQDSILDKQVITEGYFSESFILFKPKSIVSGDFYYYKPTKINNESCIVVSAVDCTGHGVPGGFLSMLGITLLNEIINTHNCNNAADILNALRLKIKFSLKQTGKDLEQKDGMDMALCIYFPDSKRVEFAGAKNPLCKISAQGKLDIFAGDRQPIGVYEIEKNFTNHTISVDKDDMLYIFSDGIIDQFGGPKGKKLMLKKLTAKLQELSTHSCEQQKTGVLKFYTDWQNEFSPVPEQVDDVVLIGMKI